MRGVRWMRWLLVASGDITLRTTRHRSVGNAAGELVNPPGSGSSGTLKYTQVTLSGEPQVGWNWTVNAT